MSGINFSDKRIKFTSHVLMWILIFLLPYILYKANERMPVIIRSDKDRLSFLYVTVFTDFLWVAVFYMNALILIPRFFDRKKYAYYAAWAGILFFMVVIVHYLLFTVFAHGHTFKLLNAVLFLMAPFFLSLAGGAIWEMWSEKRRADKLLQEKQQENLKTELSFLRSQISPHFVFNILNNIAALIRMKSDLAETAVVKLSSLLRYMLYETDEEKVPLRTEVEYLQSYIDLQKQRYGNRVPVHADFNLENDWAEIEPMLIIPFVENAFKHGVGFIEHPQIDISLYTKSNILYFCIKNRYNPGSIELKDKIPGIGLANVKRRIDLLYNGKNSLQIEKKEEFFMVSLKICLQV